jgi:hypothetical protein
MLPKPESLQQGTDPTGVPQVTAGTSLMLPRPEKNPACQEKLRDLQTKTAKITMEGVMSLS